MRSIKLFFCSVILITMLISFDVTSGKFHTPHEAGQRLFRSLLRPVPINSGDSIFEGYYSVYENRKLPGRKINLYITVIPALNNNNPGAPIFYFAGGPGGTASRMKNFFLNQIAYRSNRDIVLVDVRGTGLSNPLHCPELQTKKTAQACMDDMFPVDEIKKCYTQLVQAADLRQYTTENVVNDLEEIRKWLGYNTINVMGQSYGTRVCQSYMRQYPASVRSAIMIGPAALSMAVPVNHAYDGQKAWNLLVSDCMNDPNCNKKYPNLNDEFNIIMNRLAIKPDVFIYNKSNGEKEEVIIRKGPLGDLIRSIMYTVRGQRQIPYLIHEAFKGNYQPLIDIAVARNSDPNSIANGFYLCITCHEDIPLIKEEQKINLIVDTYLGNYRIEQQTEACNVWSGNKVYDDFYKSVSSSIPALVVSGNHDPVTPPRWGDTVVQKMNHAQHLVIPQMAHGSAGLSNETLFHSRLSDFFNQPHEKLNTDFVSEMKEPSFK